MRLVHFTCQNPWPHGTLKSQKTFPQASRLISAKWSPIARRLTWNHARSAMHRARNRGHKGYLTSWAKGGHPKP